MTAMQAHETRVRVRYAETDQMGVVYHANYIIYMEEGRTRMMEALGLPYAELERSGVGLAVRKVDVRYWSGATYDQEIVVETRIGRVRNASVEFRYELRCAAEGTRLASGGTELACIDLERKDRRPRALPDELRERLRAIAGEA